jgi:c(7)-type cytochrome triheme protein
VGRKEKPKVGRLAILLVAIVGISLYYSLGIGSSAAVSTTTEPTEPWEPSVSQDYSRFQHSNPQHARLPCLVCHVRNDNSATMRFPGHIPCASCHVEQFKDSKHPLCYNCHTENGLKRFPGLKSFNSRFDHGRHARQTNCATCHKPASQGKALSIPTGTRAHTTCFQCHGPKAQSGGKSIGSCNTCHQPGRLVRTSQSSPAFSKNFSHTDHTRKMACNACHTVRAGMPRGRQVSSPTAAMHLVPGKTQSCASCHNNTRAFGGNDFSDCKRCHEGSTFRF